MPATAESPIVQAGRAALEVAMVSGESTVTSAFASSPMKLLAPRSRGKSVWACTSSFGGGLVAGDQTRLDISPRLRCPLFSRHASFHQSLPQSRRLAVLRTRRKPCWRRMHCLFSRLIRFKPSRNRITRNARSFISLTAPDWCCSTGLHPAAPPVANAGRFPVSRAGTMFSFPANGFC